MTKNGKPTIKLPQVAIQPAIHEVLKEYAKSQGMKLAAVTDEILRAGLKVKRIVVEQPAGDQP
jgi:hypothetical protein